MGNDQSSRARTPESSFAAKEKGKLAKDTKKASTRISQGKNDIYEVRKQLTHSEPGPSKIAKYSIGKPLSLGHSNELVVMMVGATGAGKTTLINGIANYILGVDWTDKFRFKIITDEGRLSQAHSKTQTITAYTIHKYEGSRFPHTLTIVDTPGFGDPKGLERDKQISADIKNFFSLRSPKGIDHIHAVAFVTQAPMARLTQTQKYIYESILGIFGKDIADNILMLFTFSDGGKPAVLPSVREAGISFKQSFKFNNSALFLDDEDDEDEAITSRLWNMGEKSYEKFLQEVHRMTPRSLQLTREVLDEREQLKVIMQGVQQDLQGILETLEELEQEQDVVNQHKAEIEANKNFNYSVTECQSVQVDIKGQGIFVTNCLKCNYTCHGNCRYADDADKIKCSAMKSGLCKVCPRKCRWDLHKNNTFKYVQKTRTVKRTYANLQKRFETATAAGAKAKVLVEKLKAEVDRKYQDARDKVNQARKILDRLNEIALHPNPLSEVDYIDLLIKNERDNGRPGYLQRIKKLQDLRGQVELRSRVGDDTIFGERAFSQAAKVTAAVKY